MGLKSITEKYKIKHFVQRTKKGICIGSPYHHDIIVLNDDGEFLTMYKDRKYNDGWSTNKDLKRYQEEMFADIENGTLKQIIQEPDQYENLLPVFTIDDGKLVETSCEKYGYPNLTIEGEMMDNTFFKTKDEAIQYGIDECHGWIKMLRERKAELLKESDQKQDRINHFTNCLSILQASDSL